MKTVRLITCNDAMQAHILQGALENEGIESVLHNENLSSLLNGYVNSIAGVDILVAEENYEAAMLILKSNQMIPEELKFCPECGSTDLHFGLCKKHRGRTFGAAVASIFGGIPPGKNHWEYVCKACGAAFYNPVDQYHQPKSPKEL